MVFPAAARSGYQERKLERLEEYQIRKVKLEEMIADQMAAGLDFEESYRLARQRQASPEFRREVFAELAARPLPSADLPVKSGKVAELAEPVEMARAVDLAADYRKEKLLMQQSDDRRYDLAQAADQLPAPEQRPAASTIRTQTIQEIQDDFNFEDFYKEGLEHDYSRTARPEDFAPVEDSTTTEFKKRVIREGAVIEDKELRVFRQDDGRKVSGVLTPEEIIRQVMGPDRGSGKIDLNFDQTSLGDIMMTLGETAGINIVLDPVLYQNALDLHLKQVSLEEAMLLLANIYDLGFEKVGDSLFVAHKEKLSDRKLESKVIKLKNIGVNDARLLVKDLANTVNASEELNSLVVIGSPEQLVKIESVLGQIDVSQPQVIIEAKIIEINKDALKDLGVDWSDQINLQYQESGRQKQMDNLVTGPVDSVFAINKMARNALQFETAIKMLENQNKAKILSNPRVSTLNGKEAEIFVGDKLPYTITNVTGGVVTTDVRFVEPGIRLRITPSIIDEEFVILKVDPEVSFIFAFRGPNDEFPHVKTREATAHVRVKNRTPFVIGGLLNQEDKQSLYKVPFLGDVPLLGNLFSYDKHTVTDTELIITILPTIVTGSMQ
jgi:type IV pilus assembly protein PilQ